MTTHEIPPVGSGLTPCCHRSPFNLPRTDRMTREVEQVDCGDEKEANVVGSIVEAAQADHRRAWADYIESWAGAVGPTPPTVETIIAALRAPVPPFGRAAGSGQ